MHRETNRERYTNRQRERYTDGETDTWMDGWMGGLMDGRIGHTDRQIYTYIQIDKQADTWIYRYINRYADRQVHSRRDGNTQKQGQTDFVIRGIYVFGLECLSTFSDALFGFLNLIRHG
jgi:hypothetical protein